MIYFFSLSFVSSFAFSLCVFAVVWRGLRVGGGGVVWCGVVAVAVVAVRSHVARKENNTKRTN